MIMEYPEFSSLTLEQRAELHPLFQQLPDGMSELTFASFLPEKYELINREQDLGDPGLRQAKESYRPTGFVIKYRATPNS